MFKWLWRRLGLSDQDGAGEVEYDVVYGLSKRAIADWLQWNPQLEAEHQLLGHAAQSRRDKADDKRGDNPLRAKVTSLESVSGPEIPVAATTGCRDVPGRNVISRRAG